MEQTNTTRTETQNTQRAQPPQTSPSKKGQKNQGPTESSGHAEHTGDGTIEENQEEQAP